MRKFKELGRWYITRHAINDYKETVIDDPIIIRGCTATDIKGRISHALNKIEDLNKLPILDDITTCYRTKFIKRGHDYYVLMRLNQEPIPVVVIWTEIIYQNYLEGITSKGHRIYESHGC